MNIAREDRNMEGLIRRLSLSMVAATILLITGSLAWSQEIPSPVCYAIRAYVGQIDKAQKASIAADDFRRSSTLNYARDAARFGVQPVQASDTV